MHPRRFLGFCAVVALPCAAAAAPPDSHLSGPAMQEMATAYTDALLSHDGSALKLSPHVRRTENGLVNANGEPEVRASFAETKMVKAKRDLRFVVDEAAQEIVAFFLIDVSLSGPAQAETKAGDKSYKVAVTVPGGEYTVHEAERFRFQDGLISEIEIIAHVQNGLGGASGWPG